MRQRALAPGAISLKKFRPRRSTGASPVNTARQRGSKLPKWSTAVLIGA
jgi:hypothetical protein